MTLENLLAIRQLLEHQTDASALRRLLEAERLNLTDARFDQISSNNRFDAAYKCVIQCAMIGLWASGYRTSTSQPGHHQTAIQCLVHTLGVSKDDIIVLDVLRRQRNITDYEGDPVSEATLAGCIAHAEQLLLQTEQWLQVHHPAVVASP